MRRALPLLCILLIIPTIAKAQKETEQEIWNLAIKNIYRKNSISYYYPEEKYPVDPTLSRDKNAMKKIDTSDFVFYINKTLIDINNSLIEARFVHLLKISEDNAKEYTEKSQLNNLVLKTENFNFCYKVFENNKDQNILKKSDTCKIGSTNKLLPVQSIILSKIMFNKERDKALLFAHVVDNSQNVYRYFWAVSLKKIAKNWNIEKIEKTDLF